jgi:hypothetical protein
MIPSAFEDSRYEALYLPVIALAYLYYNLEWFWFRFDFFVATYTAFERTFDIVIRFPETLLLGLVVVALIGTIQLHGFARVIHGPNDPSRRKQTSLQIKYALASVTKSTVEELPEWDSSKEAWSGFFNSALSGKHELSIKNFAMLFPMFFVGLYLYLGLIGLVGTAIFGTLDFTGTLLLIALLVFKAQKWFWKPFPSVNWPESRQRSGMAEHVWQKKRYYDEMEDPESDSVSFRYSPSRKERRE